MVWFEFWREKKRKIQTNLNRVIVIELDHEFGQICSKPISEHPIHEETSESSPAVLG